MFKEYNRLTDIVRQISMAEDPHGLQLCSERLQGLFGASAHLLASIQLDRNTTAAEVRSRPMEIISAVSRDQKIIADLKVQMAAVIDQMQDGLPAFDAHVWNDQNTRWTIAKRKNSDPSVKLSETSLAVFVPTGHRSVSLLILYGAPKAATAQTVQAFHSLGLKLVSKLIAVQVKLAEQMVQTKKMSKRFKPIDRKLLNTRLPSHELAQSNNKKSLQNAA